MNGFKQITPEELSDNFFRLIAKDWTLITAGKPENYNMMTASWAGIGCLWNKNVCFLFIRPSRYTYEFTEKLDTLSLNFFTEDYRDTLTLCGKKSGRDFDKMGECNLSPITLSDGGVAFDEARIILNCKKLSAANLDSFDFIDKSVLAAYADGDYHKMYICEITEVFVK
ncbi:MAG: flavin reductase [Oscillospiraceae bacterium]|nr:flavin reductase [Oscillospiraceae bacterium]